MVTSPQKLSILQGHWYEKHICQLRNTNQSIKHFLNRKCIGRGRGNSKYKTYEKHKSKQNIENFRI